MAFPGFNPPAPELTEEQKQRKKEQDQWNARVLGDLYSKTAIFKKKRWHRIGEPDTKTDLDVMRLVAGGDLLLEPGLYKYTENKEDEPEKYIPDKYLPDEYKGQKIPSFTMNLDKNGTVGVTPPITEPLTAKKEMAVRAIAMMDFLGSQGIKTVTVEMDPGPDPLWLKSAKKHQLQKMINHASKNGLALDFEKARDFILTLPATDQDRFFKAEELLKVNQNKAKMMTGEPFLSALANMERKLDGAGGLDLATKSGDVNAKRQAVLNQTGNPPTVDGIENQIAEMKKRLDDAKTGQKKISDNIASQKYILGKPETMSKAASLKHFKYKKNLDAATEKFMAAKNERYQDELNVISDLKKDHDKSKNSMGRTIDALEREIKDLEHREEILKTQLTAMKNPNNNPAPTAAEITKIDDVLKDLAKLKTDVLEEKNKISGAKNDHAGMDQRITNSENKVRADQAQRRALHG